MTGRPISIATRGVEQLQQFPPTMVACGVANNKGESRYQVLNESGQEYHDGTWID